MDISNYMNTAAVLTELGTRIKDTRIAMNLSQTTFAAKTGTSVKTISRVENGENVNLSVYISILRELRLLENINLLIPEQKLRPTDISDGMTQKRKRASSKRMRRVTDFKWGDEK